MTAAVTLAYLASAGFRKFDGVGPKTLEALAAVEIDSVLDLITYYPRRYIDRSTQVAIRDLVIGEEALVLGTVRKAAARRTRAGRSLVEVEVSDGSSYLKCTFFNQPWRTKQLKAGMEAAFFGKVDLYKGRRQMTSPLVDLVGDRTGRIVPLYPQSEKAGVTSSDIAELVSQALAKIDEITDPLPSSVRDELNLVDRWWAFRQVHEPESMAAAQAARHRLAFDELWRLQMILVMRKRAVEREAKGIRHVVDGALVPRFHASLPFPLTGAQVRAIDEIAGDLAGPHPMHRLLQGDVGAGKTVVAVTALLMAVQGGFQGALMAPTEVLAEQHYLGVKDLLSELAVPDTTGSLFEERPVRVELLTNRTTAKQREKLAVDLVDGSVDLLIGTHALLTEGVAFRALGVIVIDEQHRFGVEQRAALRGKGDDPDVLVMTATPIPRTAAMTVYGDLDMTVLDEMPPGRKPIETRWVRGPLEESVAWERVRSEVGAGFQAYVVCPLIEESEKIEARSAQEEHDRLAAGELSGLRLGLLHGRMPAKDKESVMAAFRRGDVQVLISTTVIEVGVDVPNATVMVIEDADRFGIAQLHQLRGRVGRGGDVSYCYLLGDPSSPDGEERLAALERSTDGFELAEVDLELRGEGTIMGTRQKGRSDLKLASLRRDKELVVAARDVAFSIVDADPTLGRHADLEAEIRFLVDDDEAEFLFKS